MELLWRVFFGLFVLATLVQLVVWWLLLGRLAFRKKTRKQLDFPAAQAAFSIIVCARNEAENLLLYLPALLAQEYDSDWELIVVDDASEDETPDILRTFQAQNPDRLRVLTLKAKSSPGKKFALAQGIAAARHDCLLLTDADCRPASPHWLSRMAAALTAAPEIEIVLGYGPLAASSKPSLIQQFSQYETAFVAAQYFSLALAGVPYMGVGRNLAFKRVVFDRVGGFTSHAHLVSGDDDLLVNTAANALNTRICMDPEAFVYSFAPVHLRSWLLQKQRHLIAGTAYRWRHKILLAALSLSHVGHYFLCAVLMLAEFLPHLVAGIFLLRLISVFFVFRKILRLLQAPELIGKIPLYDALLGMSFGTIVPWFLMRKKAVGWGRDGRGASKLLKS